MVVPASILGVERGGAMKHIEICSNPPHTHTTTHTQTPLPPPRCKCYAKMFKIGLKLKQLVRSDHDAKIIILPDSKHLKSFWEKTDRKQIYWSK